MTFRFSALRRQTFSVLTLVFALGAQPVTQSLLAEEKPTAPKQASQDELPRQEAKPPATQPAPATQEQPTAQPPVAASQVVHTTAKRVASPTAEPQETSAPAPEQPAEPTPETTEADSPTPSAAPEQADEAIENSKLLIGGVATVLETKSQLPFQARVDTGATSCSIHTEEVDIADPAETMEENIGKTVRIKVKNHKDEAVWVETIISRLVLVKTSERAEKRYAVPLTLAYENREKEVRVTLNDRSEMNFPLLLGRNFLSGDFIVDVTLPQQ